MHPKLMLGLAAAVCQPLAPMRPPAVGWWRTTLTSASGPWADRLDGDGTRHWTGKPNSLTASARVDARI